jgi:8-oxo-dGTP pyrophosphatase MutT (NUDIX family)
MEPIQRQAARVLPVSPEGEVLLLQCQDPARPGEPHWISIGGALDPGESHVDAALRELREETGISASPEDLSEPLHRARYPFSWDGRSYVNDATMFAMPLEREVTINLDGLEPGEVGNVLAWGWWTPEGLRDDGTAANPDLPDVMRLALDTIGVAT